MQDVHDRLLFIQQGEGCGYTLFDHNAAYQTFFPFTEATLKITLV